MEIDRAGTDAREGEGMTRGAMSSSSASDRGSGEKASWRSCGPAVADERCSCGNAEGGEPPPGGYKWRGRVCGLAGDAEEAMERRVGDVGDTGLP